MAVVVMAAAVLWWWVSGNWFRIDDAGLGALAAALLSRTGVVLDTLNLGRNALTDTGASILASLQKR